MRWLILEVEDRRNRRLGRAKSQPCTGFQCREMTSSYLLMVWARKPLQSSEPHSDFVFWRRSLEQGVDSSNLDQRPLKLKVPEWFRLLLFYFDICDPRFPQALEISVVMERSLWLRWKDSDKGGKLETVLSETQGCIWVSRQQPIGSEMESHEWSLGKR